MTAHWQNRLQLDRQCSLTFGSKSSATPKSGSIIKRNSSLTHRTLRVRNQGLVPPSMDAGCSFRDVNTGCGSLRWCHWTERRQTTCPHPSHVMSFFFELHPLHSWHSDGTWCPTTVYEQYYLQVRLPSAKTSNRIPLAMTPWKPDGFRGHLWLSHHSDRWN